MESQKRIAGRGGAAKKQPMHFRCHAASILADHSAPVSVVLVFEVCRTVGTVPKLRHCFLPETAPVSTISEMEKSVLLCPPTYFDVIDQKNPYMAPNALIDKAKANRQWSALCTALENAGCQIELIEPVPGLEDMVFAANQVFVGSHESLGKFIVPGRMVHASRQREVPHFVEWFRRRGFKIIDLNLSENDYLEAHGDLLWHPDQSRVYAGYGFRSTLGGVNRFQEAMSQLGIEVVRLHLVDPFCYHLDTCLVPLSNESVLIYPGAYDAGSLANLRPFWKRVHELTSEEAHKFMGNGMVVNGRYLTPYLTQRLENILQSEGLKPVIVDSSEFEKSGGSLFCMKVFLP